MFGMNGDPNPGPAKTDDKNANAPVAINPELAAAKAEAAAAQAQLKTTQDLLARAQDATTAAQQQTRNLLIAVGVAWLANWWLHRKS